MRMMRMMRIGDANLRMKCESTNMRIKMIRMMRMKMRMTRIMRICYVNLQICE
jgi:hypothetical protein